MDSPETDASASRVYVITGDSPGELIGRLNDVAADGSSLSESFAFDDHAACRMVIVADGVETLRESARRSAERIERRPDKAIHDVRGMYYQPVPLGADGRVGWLFPGEGAQYLGMLQGLESQWREVARILHASDEVADQIGGDYRGLRYFIDQWPRYDSRPQAEHRLRRLDNAMLSVLSAGWCLSEVARRLGIPMHAAAGHSAGELAALMIGGSMQTNTDLHLFAAVMNEMERESGGGNASLLAIAAPADQVREVVVETLRVADRDEQAFVAMDNCPHQSIVVGLAEAVTCVQQAAESAGWIIESLPLQQPYHTPMFASTCSRFVKRSIASD
ncbi:MAG: hypothetical protein R3C05_31595 [Pirellulaceae bacterium]